MRFRCVRTSFSTSPRSSSSIIWLSWRMASRIVRSSSFRTRSSDTAAPPSGGSRLGASVRHLSDDWRRLVGVLSHFPSEPCPRLGRASSNNEEASMLTAVPLPDQPLTILWQSTLIDIEPGSRYGYRNDAAAINTTLAIVNNTGADLTFPLILATTDPEDRDPTHRQVRIASDTPALDPVEVDTEWETL